MTLIRILAAICCFMLPPLAAAQSYDMVVKAEILPGWRAKDGTHIAGLQISLNPGWKTYWRAPGDAGIPPVISWTGANLGDVEVLWPTPHVFSQSGMNSVGYKGTVILPVRITARDSARPIRLNGKLNIGVCRNICVPQTLEVSGHLPAEGGKRDGRIASAIVDQPLTAKQAGVTAATCRVSPTKDGMKIVATVTMPSAGPPEFTVIEAGDPEIWVAESTTRRTGSMLTAETEMMHVSGGAFVLDRSRIRLTVLGGSHAVDIRGCTAG